MRGPYVHRWHGEAAQSSPDYGPGRQAAEPYVYTSPSLAEYPHLPRVARLLMRNFQRMIAICSSGHRVRHTGGYPHDGLPGRARGVAGRKLRHHRRVRRSLAERRWLRRRYKSSHVQKPVPSGDGDGAGVVRAMLADEARKAWTGSSSSPADGYGAWAAGHPETATSRWRPRRPPLRVHAGVRPLRACRASSA